MHLSCSKSGPPRRSAPVHFLARMCDKEMQHTLLRASVHATQQASATLARVIACAQENAPRSSMTRPIRSVAYNEIGRYSVQSTLEISRILHRSRYNNNGKVHINFQESLRINVPQVQIKYSVLSTVERTKKSSVFLSVRFVPFQRSAPLAKVHGIFYGIFQEEKWRKKKNLDRFVPVSIVRQTLNCEIVY